ncbi:MAG: hypothetical protein Q9160_000219 [Pyrenula sp. 1 TL-2023]
MSKREQINWRAQTNRRSRWKQHVTFENGDCGIFVTCDRGREKRCLDELYDVLGEYNTQDTGQPDVDHNTSQDQGDAHDLKNDDLEASIARELEELKASKTSSTNTMRHIEIEPQCINFMRLPKQLDPVQIVHSICSRAKSDPNNKRTRYIQRMTPMTKIKKGLPSAIEDLSNEFAIRPTIRESGSLDRDRVIQLVADAVMKGESHTVDLKNYDSLVLVDVYRNVCGMSVVGADYRELKGYNLAELYQPFTPASAKDDKMSRVDAPNTQGHTKDG